MATSSAETGPRECFNCGETVFSHMLSITGE